MLQAGCCCLALATCLGGPARGRTTAPAQDTGYLVDRWSTLDGLPLDHITALATDTGGFLWLATLDGLVRFDGINFQVYRKGDHPELPGNRFVSLAAGLDHEIWAVTEDGHLVRYDGEHFSVFRAADFGGVRFDHLKKAGGVQYVTGVSGLWALRDGRPGLVPGIDPEARTLSVTSAEGATWVGTNGSGLLYIDDEEPARPVDATLALTDLRAIAVHPDGGLWLGGSEGLFRLREGMLTPAVEPGGQPLDAVCQVSSDRHPWVRTINEAVKLEDGQVVWREPFPSNNCLGIDHTDLSTWRLGPSRLDRLGDVLLTLDHPIRDLEQSGPDSVWVATDGSGLLRVRPRTVRAEVLTDHSLQTVLIDEQRRTWVGAYGGRVQRIDPEGLWTAPPWRAEPPPTSTFPAMALDELGRIWLSTDEGVCVVEGEECLPAGVPGAAPGDGVIRAILPTADGRAWVGLDSELVVGREEHGRWTWEAVPGPDGEPVGAPGTIVESQEGEVWVGTRGEGVVRVGDRGARWTTDDGLSSNTIRALWLAPDGLVWIGTEDAGLCRLDPQARQGGVVCLARQDGLYDDAIHSIMPDDQERLWMSTNRGIFWVHLADIEAFVEGRQPLVFSVGLDERDGMLNREANGGAQPAAARDDLGRLYFPTQAGIVVIDPARVDVPTAPAVFLESVQTKNRRLSRRGPVELQSDERSLSISWTAPEFHRPGQLRYRYRLVGFDDDWHDPTDQRSATWLNLPAGEFELEVQAGLGGRWSPITGRLSIRRQPAFVETPLFYALLGLGILLMSGGGAALRVRRLRARQQELEALVEARTTALARTNQTLASTNEKLGVQARQLAEQSVAIQAQSEQLQEQVSTLTCQNVEIQAQSERLAEMDELRTRLIADLSHELRTPLTLVLGPLEDLAESGEVPAGPAGDRLDVIRRNTRRLAALVDQLLDIARLKSGKIFIRVRHWDVSAFLRELAQRFQAGCVRSGLTLQLSLPEEPVPLYFDPDLMDKIVGNLLSNAIKFTPSGGWIRLSLHAPAHGLTDGEPIRVEVQDSGPGIATDIQPRLFERFAQGESGDQRRFEGLGIGLALARDLVELHGGLIGVSSTLGQGSTFWFELPTGSAHLTPDDIDTDSHSDAKPSPLAEALLPPTPALPDTTDRPRVLVVEDHPDMRSFLASHLQRRFQVRCAASGVEALGMLDDFAPAVIVSDVMMPEMDGLTLCRRLRADPKTAAIPILLASAKASADDRVAGLELADDYLTKPLQMRELLLRVERLTKRTATPPSEDEAPPALPAVDQKLLERIEEAIADNRADTTFNVQRMAKVLAYSRRQLQREVQRVAGMGPSELLRTRRLEHGRSLLLAGQVSTVGEVAAEVGMSHTYFARLYKNLYGSSPSADLRR